MLCWHLKGWCGPEHHSVMPLGLRCPLSLSYFLALSNSLFYWPGWVSTINSVELCQGSGKWISSRAWAWLCWPRLRGVSRGRAGLADIISQIWAKTANIKKCMHENFLDQFQRQQSQWGIQHRKNSCWKGRAGHPLTLSFKQCFMPCTVNMDLSDKKTGLNVRLNIEIMQSLTRMSH